MGYPEGRGECFKCERPIVFWDCGTPGHACHKEDAPDDYEGPDSYTLRNGKKLQNHWCRPIENEDVL